MYPVKLGFQEAKNRIESLITNGHHAEALVTSVFTIEKTIRRTLTQLIISSGFTSEQSDKIVGNLRGLESLKDVWPLYDPANEKLANIINNKNWGVLSKAGRMRNELIHGIRVFKLEECKGITVEVLEALDLVVTAFNKRYGYDGWAPRKSRKKHALHKDPKVKIIKAK